MTIGGSSAVASICSKCGARWRDCPPEYGPYTTIYNRFNRAKRGRWGATGGAFCFNEHFDGLSTAKIGLNYRFW
jgi:transposase